MKHLKQLSILLLLFIPFILNAEVQDKIFNQDRTVSNHSLYLNLLGLTYAYEHSIATRGTILFRAGTSYSFGKTLGINMNQDEDLYLTTNDYHLLTGSLGIEPRFYYNLSKRHRKEKRTFCNSGAYLSTELSYFFPIAITSGIHSAHFFSLTPYWGFRRVWNHFLFDLSGGISYRISTNKESAITPTLRLGLGYKF